MNSRDNNVFSLIENAREWLESIEACRITCTRFRIFIEENMAEGYEADEKQSSKYLAWCLNAPLPPKRSECESDEDWLNAIMTWMDHAKMHVSESANWFAALPASDVTIAVRNVEELARNLHYKALGVFALLSASDETGMDRV